MRELNGTSANCTSTALHKNGLALDRTRDVNRPMSRYTGNAETCTLFQRHAFGELNHELQGNHGVLGSGSKGTIALSAITPHAATDPFPRNAITDCVNSARTIAVRNDAWVRHPDTERILALLDIPGIHAREGDPNANVTRERLRIIDLTDGQDITRSALFFVPSGFHGLSLSLDGELEGKNTRVTNEVVQIDLYFDDANSCVEPEKTIMTNLDQKTIFITGASAGLAARGASLDT